MKKAKKLSYILLVSMLLQIITPMNFVFGGTGTNVGDRIKDSDVNIEIYDGDILIESKDNGSYENVPVGAEIKLSYDFSFLNYEDDNENKDPYNYYEDDYFYINFPEPIKFDVPSSGLPLKIGSETIGTLTLDSSTAKIVFTDYVNNRSDIRAKFDIYGSFKEGIINEGKTVSIDLEYNGKTIDISFEEEIIEPVNLIVTKDGTLNASTGEITWNIKVTPDEGKTAHNVTISDLFSNNQEFLDGSFTIALNGGASTTTTTGITASTTGFDYAFTEPISGEQIITYKTKVKDHTYSSENKNNNSIVYKNTVKAFIDDEPKGQAVKEIEINWIKKSGSEADNGKKIKWTINIENYNGLLNEKGAKIVDTLRTGHDFVLNDSNYPITIKLDNDAARIVTTTSNDIIGNYKLTNDDRTITYDFGANANFSYATLTYYTEINNPTANSNATVKYYNDAELKWSANTSGPSVEGSFGIGKGIIQKFAGNKYTYSNTSNEINWTVTINKNRVHITDAVFEDTIPQGVTYKAGSFKLNNVSVTPTVSDSIISYNLGNISDKMTITYTTTINNDFNELFSNNDNLEFKNNVKLSGGGITGDPSDSATQYIRSQVIEKSVLENYDYETRTVKWQIVVNRNKMPLTNATITDTIPFGMTFLPDTFTVDNLKVTLGDNQYTIHGDNDLENRDSFNYTFPSTSNEHIITFETKVKEAYLLQSNNLNKELSFKNDSGITSNGFTGNPKVSATATMQNNIVKKSGVREGLDYVKWSIPINHNLLNIENMTITDELQEGLSLDLDSVKLYKANIDGNGLFTKGNEINLTDNSDYFFSYNKDTRIFTFTFNSHTNEAYQLEFLTDVLVNSIKINNEISFNGSGQYVSDSAAELNVRLDNFDGSGSATNGSLTIRKVNSDGDLLPGAEFKVYDKLNTVRTGTETNGETFYSALPYRWYYIEEIKAPDGYLIDKSVIHEVKVKSEIGAVLTITNKKALANIELVKKDNVSNLLADAVFTLFDENDEEVKTVTSQENIIDGISGNVLFENIEPGKYTIKETAAPSGYKLLSDTIIEVEVKINDEQTAVNVILTLGDEVVENGPLTIYNELVDVFGDIILNKVDVNNEHLSGAEFTLYGSSNDEIATVTSDENGIVKFIKLPPGNYTVKETKAPNGYYKSTDVIETNITRSGNLIDTVVKYKVNDGEFSANNPAITNESIDFIIYKTDKDNNPLDGAEFTLYNENAEEIMTVISDDFGEVKFEKVEIGNYTIKETKAPSGCYKSDAVINVEVKESNKPAGAEVILSINPINEEVSKDEEGNIIVVNERIPNTTRYGKIAIKKTDVDGKVLKGAEFTLFDKNGNVVDKGTTNSDGTVAFNRIARGKYVLKETKAPEGYVSLDIETTVEIKGSEIKTFTFENEKEKEPEIPETEKSIDPETEKPIDPETSKPGKPDDELSVDDSNIPSGGINIEDNEDNNDDAGTLPDTGGVLNSAIIIILGIFISLLGIIFMIKKPA